MDISGHRVKWVIVSEMERFLQNIFEFDGQNNFFKFICIMIKLEKIYWTLSYKKTFVVFGPCITISFFDL
jgi:hypothetical protein